MFCRNCGAKLAEGAKFCGSCGMKLQIAEGTGNSSFPVKSNPKLPRRKKGSAKKVIIPLAAVMVLVLAAVLVLPLVGGKTVYLKTGTTQVDELNDIEHSWEYDDDGNLTGYTYSIEYRGALSGEEGPSFSWEYEYENGKIVWAEYEDNDRSFELEYVYDGNGNLEAVESDDFEGEVECDNEGRILEFDFDGIECGGEYSYYKNGQLKESDYTRGDMRFCYSYREDGQVSERVLYYNGEKYSTTQTEYTDSGDTAEITVRVYNSGEVTLENTYTYEYNKKGDLIGFTLEMNNQVAEMTMECEVERDGTAQEYIITDLSGDPERFTDLEEGDTYLEEEYDDNGNLLCGISYMNGKSKTEHEYAAFKAPRGYIAPNKDHAVYFQLLGNVS